MTALAVAAFSVVTSGCGGEESGTDGTAGTGTSSTGPETTMQTLDPDDQPTGPKLHDPEDAVDDIVVTDCGNGTGEVRATGYVHNSSAARADYVINVSWVTSKGAMVAHAVTTAEDVAPDARMNWVATTTLADDGAYACSTSIERGTL